MVFFFFWGGGVRVRVRVQVRFFFWGGGGGSGSGSGSGSARVPYGHGTLSFLPPEVEDGAIPRNLQTGQPLPKEAEPILRNSSDSCRRLGCLVAGVLGGNTIRGNRTHNSERKMAL